MASIILRFLSCLVFLLIGAVVGVQAEGLRAGAAKSVITPQLESAKVFIAGFGNNRVATGVHDDLYARCLALAAGRETIALCSVDLIGLFYDDVVKIREKMKAKAPGVTHLVVASTHNHQGPDTMGLWGPARFESGIDDKYMEWLQDRVAETAARAAGSLQAALLTLGRDDHPLIALLQADSRPPYVKDPFLFAMRLAATSSGKTIATLVNWSNHPETLGRNNTEITADYPRWVCKYLEGRLGGTVVFFNGSVGGLLSTLGKEVALQDPVTGQIAEDGTWIKAELIGTTVGRLAERALHQGERINVDSLVVRKSVFFAPLQNDRFRVAGALGVFRGRKPLYSQQRLDSGTAKKVFSQYGEVPYMTGADVQTEVNYIALLTTGRVMAEIVTIPGEIYPELVNGGTARFPGADFPDALFEPAIRAKLKSKYQFIFGMANDELGYIIPKAEWDEHPPWLSHRPERWYGEINSVGPETAGAVMRALVCLIEQEEHKQAEVPTNVRKPRRGTSKDRGSSISSRGEGAE